MDTAIATARGVDGGDTGATTTDGQCFFQDRSHQYVETKGRHPGTEPNTNPFRETQKTRARRASQGLANRCSRADGAPVDYARKLGLSVRILKMLSSPMVRVKL